MQGDNQETKAAIRRRMRALLKAVPSHERRDASLKVCQLLKQQEAWRNARSILFYAPLADELDLATLWSDAFAQAKEVVLPRFVPAQSAYEACRLDRIEQSLAPGQFAILEPDSTCAPVPLNQLDLVLVPGVAFDVRGRRLGRGRGFYDRLLKDMSAMKCGVAYDWQIEPEIPVESHDIRVDCILTPTQWRDCSQGVAVK
jgi:5-formyltetrahydrofolate cyclo-ligase